MNHHVEVIVGSPSDYRFVKASNLGKILHTAGVTFTIGSCSAHRCLFDLIEYVERTYPRTTAYICAAGMAADLPKVVKAIVLRKKHMPVFGVALSSNDYPDAADATLCITRVPPGLEVNYSGVDSVGLDAAAQAVVDLLKSLPDEVEAARLLEADIAALAKKTPEFDINLEEV